MADILYPLASDEDLPQLETYNALGTMLLHNSRADESGGFLATCWFMIILPLFPLGRYYVRQTGFSDESGLLSTRTITRYEIIGRSRVRWIETVRTYLAFWIVVPAIVVGPVIVSLDMKDENAQLYAMFISVGLMILVFTLFFVYRTYWRPVRQVRWAEAATDRRDGRRWQEFAWKLQLAFLMGLVGFVAGVAIFFTAMAMDELPTDSDPEPNPFASTLLHPVTCLVGTPVLTGMITLAILVGRDRRSRR
ncbi:hypothetical protein ACH5AO_07610 [Streptomyces sp. NPDC018964]|uniref:hypothetical protein n=1 Tax=Streptomyces sp. NPDC018964 TaxID=3365058 RepID=UPI0037AD7493